MSNENERDIIERILLERQRQADKWGDDDGMHDYVWLGIAIEELGEAAQALNRADGEKLERELVQTAAVIVAWLAAR